jgi:predicted flap endonuclease-1-like 5' DNA nuclease
LPLRCSRAVVFPIDCDMLHCNMVGLTPPCYPKGAWLMALSHEFPTADVVGERTERVLRLPLGVTSPLWAVFGAAAGMGVAYWWMTRWTRAVNFEAFAPFAAKLAAEPEAIPAETPAAIAAPAVVEALAPKPEPMIEPKTVIEPGPVVEPEPAVEAAVAVVEAAIDDLTVMTGIGPKLAAALTERGVTRFSQIAAWTAEDIAAVDAELSLKGRAVRESWVAQAKRLAAAH